MRENTTKLLWVQVIIVVGGLAIGPLPTSAQQNWQYPQQNAACARNERVGEPVSLYAYKPSENPDAWQSVYYGWAEFRYGTEGSCKGYQWVTLHFTSSLKVNEELAIVLAAVTSCNAEQAERVSSTRWATTTFGAGSYTNSKVIYSPDHKVVSEVGSGLDSNGWPLLFGYHTPFGIASTPLCG